MRDKVRNVRNVRLLGRCTIPLLPALHAFITTSFKFLRCSRRRKYLREFGEQRKLGEEIVIVRDDGNNVILSPVIRLETVQQHSPPGGTCCETTGRTVGRDSVRGVHAPKCPSRNAVKEICNIHRHSELVRFSTESSPRTSNKSAREFSNRCGDALGRVRESSEEFITARARADCDPSAKQHSHLDQLSQLHLPRIEHEQKPHCTWRSLCAPAG